MLFSLSLSPPHTTFTTPVTHLPLPLSASFCVHISRPQSRLSPSPRLPVLTPSYSLHIVFLSALHQPISFSSCLLPPFAIVSSHKPLWAVQPSLRSHFFFCTPPPPLLLLASSHSFIYPHWHIDTLIQLEGLTRHLFTSHWHGLFL